MVTFGIANVILLILSGIFYFFYVYEVHRPRLETFIKFLVFLSIANIIIAIGVSIILEVNETTLKFPRIHID